MYIVFLLTFCLIVAPAYVVLISMINTIKDNLDEVKWRLRKVDEDVIQIRSRQLEILDAIIVALKRDKKLEEQDGFEPYTEGWEDDPDNINELIDEYQFHPVEWNEDAEEFEHLGDDKKPASINGVSKKQRDEEIEILDEEE